MPPTKSPKVDFATAQIAHRLRWREGAFDDSERAIAEETAIAIVHDASTTAVMMATPSDLEDFAIGFSFSEGVIGDFAEVRDLEIAAAPQGIELRIWLADAPAAVLAARRRRLVGPTGCGLCGIESLEQAAHPPRPVTSDGVISAHGVLQALEALEQA